MNKRIVSILVAVVLVVIANVASAQTRVKYTLMPVEGFYSQHGETHPLAPSLSQGVVVSHRFGSFGWLDEIDVVTPFTAVNPSVQLVLGPFWNLSDKLYVSPVALARYIPEQKGGLHDGFMLGGSFVFGIVVSKEITLGTGVGLAKVVSGEGAKDDKWCFTVGPKIALTLF